MIELSNVSASYGTVPAITGVTINVGEGEAVGLLGANGAGKSTTLRAISGLVKLTSGSVTFAGTPGWSAALQEFVDLNNAGCFHQGAAADTIIQASQQLGSGQAVMWIAPSAAIASIANANPNFKVAMMPIPGPTADATRAVTEYNDSFSVNAHSKNIDAAMKLVNFLATPDQQRAYAKIEGEISVPDSVTGTLPPQYSAFASLMQANKGVTLPSLVWPNPAVGTTLTPDMQGLLTGQKMVKDVLADLDNAWNSAPPTAAAPAASTSGAAAPATSTSGAAAAAPASASAAAKPSASS